VLFRSHAGDEDAGGAKGKGKKGSNKKSRTAEAEQVSDEFFAPRYRSTLVIMGIAPTHQDIARYVSALQSSELLTGIELKVSETTMIKERDMIKFRIEGRIDPAADPRRTRTNDDDHDGERDVVASVSDDDDLLNSSDSPEGE